MSGAELALDVEVPGPTGGSDELKEKETEWAALASAVIGHGAKH